MEMCIRDRVKGAEVEVSLTDKEGKVIYTERQRAKDNKLRFLKHIEAPLLWSAEKPNLYQMMITLRANGQTQYICRNIGLDVYKRQKLACLHCGL